MYKKDHVFTEIIFLFSMYVISSTDIKESNIVRKLFHLSIIKPENNYHFLLDIALRLPIYITI